uniref:Uncharacterized protein n=1 Tax=Mola mola TaxID=94237 RepID=A0A3Q3VTP5_MOLML
MSAALKALKRLKPTFSNFAGRIDSLTSSKKDVNVRRKYKRWGAMNLLHSFFRDAVVTFEECVTFVAALSCIYGKNKHLATLTPDILYFINFIV